MTTNPKWNKWRTLPNYKYAFEYFFEPIEVADELLVANESVADADTNYQASCMALGQLPSWSEIQYEEKCRLKGIPL